MGRGRNRDLKRSGRIFREGPSRLPVAFRRRQGSDEAEGPVSLG